MAMIENDKSKRVRRKLLQDQLMLVEALKYARGLESADQHATKVERQAPNDVTVKQEVNKITEDRSREKSCFNCRKHWPHQGGPRKCPAFGIQCTRCGKRNHFHTGQLNMQPPESARTNSCSEGNYGENSQRSSDNLNIRTTR